MLLLIGLGYAIPKYYLVDTKVAANDSCHNDKVSAQICLNTLMQNQKVIVIVIDSLFLKMTSAPKENSKM